MQKGWNSHVYLGIPDFFSVHHPELSSPSSESYNAGGANAQMNEEMDFLTTARTIRHPLHPSEPPMIDVLGPNLAFWIVSRAGQEETPTEIETLISMQGHSKGGSWLHPSALSNCR